MEEVEWSMGREGSGLKKAHMSVWGRRSHILG
jgi:hypothetical protein